MLAGKRIAILTSNTGVEKAELTDPLHAITGADGQADLIAPEEGDVQTMVSDIDKSSRFPVDHAVADVSADDYSALVIPGGTVNADKLRLQPDALNFLRAFVDAFKPVAAICHGPWVLLEAGVLRGKTLTSYPSLRTDIENAGGTWVDEEVTHCTTDGWDLITSRRPDDLHAFTHTFLEIFARA